MAELKCKDGTVIQISDETEQELRKAFGEKYYTVGQWFYRPTAPNGKLAKLVKMSGKRVALRVDSQILREDTDSYCWTIKEVDDVYQVPFSIIKKLTSYSNGMYPVNVKIVEDN